MLEAGEKNGHQIEKDLGIGNGQVYRWRKGLEASGERAFAPPGRLWQADDPILLLSAWDV